MDSWGSYKHHDPDSQTAAFTTLVDGMNRLGKLSALVKTEVQRIGADILRIGTTFTDIALMVESNQDAIDRLNARIARFKV